MDPQESPNPQPEENPYAYTGSGESPTAKPRSAEVWALGFLFGAMYFIQGIAEPTAGLISQPFRSLLNSWGESAGTIGWSMFFVSLPWSVKPLFGLFADFVPFFGTRQKGYLVLCNGLAVLSLLALYLVPWGPGSTVLLCALLFVPTAAVAFGDVLVDALMIQKGQARGLTGTYQGIQWAAIYVAMILTGTLGGWLSEQNRQALGFLICAAISLPGLFLSLLCVHEEPRVGPRPSLWSAVADLKEALRTPALWAVGGFIFLWNFNPFSATVLQLHMTDELQFGEQFFGNMLSLSGVASVVASGLYALYCRRVPRAVLIHASILLGVVSTLGYWWLSTKTSAIVITLAVSFTYMTALLIQLDLAARACPPRAAGTVFATLMALSNLSYSLSTGVGGSLYDLFAARWDKPTSFSALVLIGAACTAACWLLAPLLRVQGSEVRVQE